MRSDSEQAAVGHIQLTEPSFLCTDSVQLNWGSWLSGEITGYVCLRLRCRLIVDALGVGKIGIAMVSVGSITRGMGSQGYVAVNS